MKTRVLMSWGWVEKPFEYLEQGDVFMLVEAGEVEYGQVYVCGKETVKNEGGEFSCVAKVLEATSVRITRG